MMDEMEMLFSELSPQELDELLTNIDIPEDKALSERIGNRLGVTKKANIINLPARYIVSVAAAVCFLIASLTVFTVRTNKSPEAAIPSDTTSTVTQVSAPAENPLMVAISTGDEDLITRLLSLPGLISREALEFALNLSEHLSYDTLHQIALSVKENLGSTGLDGLLESSIFGDSQRALEELRKRDKLLMTPFEKLAFFFAVAFCDSEVVDEFISKGYDINFKDAQGNSIYAIAEKYGNEENMQYAISKGITH